MRQQKRLDSRQLAALAYRDAVRDILGDEGIFALTHRRAPDVLWEFDGHAWRRSDLSRLDDVEQRGAARLDPARHSDLPV